MSIDQLSSNNNVQTEEQELDEALSESKPDDNNLEAKTGYDLLRKSNQNARELLRDALSCTNNLRRDLAFKAISPAHTTTRNKKDVFGNKLKNVVKEEIAKSKLYNNTNKEKLTHENKIMDIIALINQANPDRIRETSNGMTNMAVVHDYKPNTGTVKLKISTIKKDMLNYSNMDTVKKEIQNLVMTQAIQQISEQSPCFTSNILVIDKKNGKKHVVLDLRLINTFMKHTYFKMESINIELRSRGICIVAYLDDLLIMAKGKQALERNLKLVWNLFTKLGHNYPSPKEKDKPNETRLQYISKEASDPCQEISVNNRETAATANAVECINKWSVEQQGTKTPYQHPRNKSDPVCVHNIQRPNREVSLDQVGQLDMYSLSQPPGSGINIGNMPSNEDQTESPTLTGYGQ
ncbi:32103_t:CDS:2, partial [Gigaspora margarita]